MPEVSRFFGIVVKMFYNDHEPPHFHALYSGQMALISIRDLKVLGGSLPPRALGLVIEWAVLHQEALMENWERARRKEPLVRIPPLE